MTPPAEPESTSKPAKPGILARVRARFGWLDHVMRAQQRYNDSKGDFFAAGITYFTVFALFPLLMVGFAAAGFVLSRNPELLADIEAQIKSRVSGDFGQQLVNLMASNDLNTVDLRDSDRRIVLKRGARSFPLPYAARGSPIMPWLIQAMFAWRTTSRPIHEHNI